MPAGFILEVIVCCSDLGFPRDHESKLYVLVVMQWGWDLGKLSCSSLCRWFAIQVWVIYLILLSRSSGKWMWLHCCIVVNVTVKYCMFSNIILFQISANCYWNLERGTCDMIDTLPWREKSSCLENEGTSKIATCTTPSCTFVLQFYQQEFENLE